MTKKTNDYDKKCIKLKYFRCPINKTIETFFIKIINIMQKFSWINVQRNYKKYRNAI